MHAGSHVAFAPAAGFPERLGHDRSPAVATTCFCASCATPGGGLFCERSLPTLSPFFRSLEHLPCCAGDPSTAGLINRFVPSPLVRQFREALTNALRAREGFRVNWFTPKHLTLLLLWRRLWAIDCCLAARLKSWTGNHATETIGIGGPTGVTDAGIAIQRREFTFSTLIHSERSSVVPAS